MQKKSGMQQFLCHPDGSADDMREIEPAAAEPDAVEPKVAALEWELPGDLEAASSPMGFDVRLPLHRVEELSYFAKPHETNDGWAGAHWRPTENGW